MWIIWTVIGVIGLLAMLIVVPPVVMRAIKSGLQKRVSAVHAHDHIILADYRALSLGITSKGKLQSRGNGALVLTADVVHWFQVAPAFDLRISRANITAVETVRSHLGKSLFRDLLRVTFTHEGAEDSIAWNVTDLKAWLSHLAPATRQARD